jgi:hypothetical protein
MPKGSKYYTTSKAAATTGTPLADITDANITDPNKRQKLDGDSDFALDPKLQAAADGCVFRADALDAASHLRQPRMVHTTTCSMTNVMPPMRRSTRRPSLTWRRTT